MSALWFVWYVNILPIISEADIIHTLIAVFTERDIHNSNRETPEKEGKPTKHLTYEQVAGLKGRSVW